MIVCSCCSAWLAWDIVRGTVLAPPPLLHVVFATIAAYAIADLVSGVVHYVADRFGSPSTPLIGSKLIAPFREHHSRPRDILDHDFLEANGDSCLMALLVVVPALFVSPERGGSAAAAGWFALTLALWVVATSQIHQWAHSDTPPKIVRLLQSAGIILRPEEHARHHQPPFDRAYCTTSGLLNPLLDALGVFRIGRPRVSEHVAPPAEHRR